MPPIASHLLYFMADLGLQRLHVYLKYKLGCWWFATLYTLSQITKSQDFVRTVKNPFVAKTLFHELTNSVYSRF